MLRVLFCFAFYSVESGVTAKEAKVGTVNQG